ncbi:MAG: outer-membrane lipoprotein carrier protein LolA [Pseudomonadota bacterium]
MFSRHLAAAAAMLLASVVLAGPAAAQQKAQQASEGGWGSQVNAASGTVGSTFADEDISAIETVSNYFNALKTLKGRFIQTDPAGKRSKGKVFVAKPGRFRFEYNRPSRKVVISDGRFLAVQDRDLETDETYELTNTPFRMLLRREVNLLRDAQVLEVKRDPDQISLVLRDKDPDVPSAIKVVVTTTPQVALRGWITRDAQGLETKVEVFNVSHGDKLSAKLFEREKFFMNKIR